MQNKSNNECNCLTIPVGTSVSDKNLDYHLRSISKSRHGWSGYSICPYTGVVWRWEQYEDFTGLYSVWYTSYERTAVQQTERLSYTLAKTHITLYAEPLKHTSDEVMRYRLGLPPETAIPHFPALPLEGQIWDVFFHEAPVSWEAEGISACDQKLSLLWLYLPQPLEAGTTVQGWLASPLEAITAQVLVPGFLLEWRWYGGTIGELVVEVQERVLASQYHQYFGFDRPHRDLVEESSEILRSARQGRSRRRK